MSDDHDDDWQHEDFYQETGFWGAQAAGCMIYARSTGRVMLDLRSGRVLEPHTWGTWGGAVPHGMTPEETVLMEVRQETGYIGELRLVPLVVFEHQESGFRYHNFLAVVEDEFEPELSRESDDGRWFTPGEWPDQLHPGVEFILSRYPDPTVVARRDAGVPYL